MQLKFSFNGKVILEYSKESKNYIGMPKKCDDIIIDNEKYKIIGFNAFDTVVAYKVEKCEI